MTDISIEGGRVLLGDEFAEVSLKVAGREIHTIGSGHGRGAVAIDARRLLEAIEGLRPQLAADTRLHLRHETYHLEADAEIDQWLSEGRIDLFAFNDHMDATSSWWATRY